MMGSLKRVEQRPVSSQSMANDIENRTRIDVTGKSAAIEGRRATLSEELVGQHVRCKGRARDRFHGWDMLIPKHEAGKWIQQDTKGTLRATAAWTDGRRAVDDQYVELDHELAVALASVREGAAASTVMNVTQVQPTHGYRGMASCD